MKIFKEPTNTNATTLSVALSAVAGAVIGATIWVLRFAGPRDAGFELYFPMAWTGVLGAMYGAALNRNVQWTRPKGKVSKNNSDPENS